MARREAHLHASPARIFEVLEDHRTYEHWVVGTSEIRAVEGSWPQVGSSLHYTVGRWPVRLQDQTVVCTYEPGRRLTLEAHAQLLGSAVIDIEVIPEGDGARVVIDEHPISGLGAKLHNRFIESLLRVRNVGMIRRLKDLVENPD